MRDDAALIWGSTALVIDRAQVAGLDWWVEVSADGTTWGNAEAVITAIKSHLQDGSLAEVTSFDNRQAPIHLAVCSQTYEGLQDGEMAILAEANVPGYNTLTWTPSKSYAQPTVFDVVYATTAHDFDDLSETAVLVGGHLRRKFVATLECLPFGRDVSMTSVQATAQQTAPVSTTLVDACSSTTNWVGTLDGNVATLVVDDGALRFPSQPATLSTFTRNATVDFSVESYLSVDFTGEVRLNAGGFFAAELYVNGTTANAQEVATGISPARPGWTRKTWRVLVSSATQVAFNFTRSNATFMDGDTTRIDNVVRSNQAPFSGTKKQQYRSLSVGGSARARAALAITAQAGQTLGDLTLLYTRTATTGLQPPMRPYRASSSSVATEDAAISGAYNSFLTPMVFTIPANKVREAAHSMVLRLRASTAGDYTISWSAALVSAANSDLRETSQAISGSTTVSFASTGVWQVSEVGLLGLPTVPVAADSTHLLRITLVASSAAVQLDEGWLFDLDNGVLSWVETAGMTRLEVRTADLNSPEPSYWGGAVDGGVPAGMVRADYRVQSFGVHVFEPGDIDVFTVTSGTEGSACAVSYYRTWIHHAGLPEAG